MARQRFIHPEIWKDKRFGELKHDEQVMFIALFSLADDEGRILADPMYLRSEVFPYRDYTAKRVRAIRDTLVAAMPHVWLYEADGAELIALLKWRDYQKPKYPKASKLPPPQIEEQLTLPPRLEEDFPKDDPGLPPQTGQDRVGKGLDWEGQDRGSADYDPGGNGFKIPDPVLRLLAVLPDKDDGTERELRKRVDHYKLGEGDLEEAREAALSPTAHSPTAVAMSVLKKRGEAKNS